MGVIKKQSIQSTIYSYIGVGIGFLNSSIIMPKLLTVEQVGLFSFFNSLTSIFAALFTLGVPLITIRLFPRLRDHSSRHHGLFSFNLIVTLLGILIGSLSFILLQDHVITDTNSAKHFHYFALGFILLFAFRSFSRNFDSYIRMLFNTVLGSILDNFVIKIAIFILLGSYWLANGFDIVLFFFLYTATLSIPGIVSIVYLIIKREANFEISAFRRKTRGWGKEIRSLSIYGLLGTLGGIIVLEVDRVMVSNMLGLEANAVYSISFFFGLFCSVPARAMKRIASVVIAEAWEQNDLDTIKEVYDKSSINLFLVGVYLFLGVWVNVDYVLQVLPEAYHSGKTVIFIIGIAQLLDLATGVNNEVIGTSKYYKYITYFTSILIILVIGLNYLLIPIMGIEGAALASLLALLSFNILKTIFLYKKINHQPLNYRFVLVIASGTLVWSICNFTLPTFDNIYVGILITGSVLTIVYWIPVYLLKISEDVNSTIDKVIKR